MASDFLSIIEPANRNQQDERGEPAAGGRVLPVLPVRDTVLFPHAVLPLTVGRESSIQLIQSLGEEKTIVVVAQRDARVDAPQPSDLHAVGTLATVHKVVKMPNQSLFVFTEGTQRVKLGEFNQFEPFMTASVEPVPEITPAKGAEIEALQRNVTSQFQQIVTSSPTLVGRAADDRAEHRRSGPAGGLHRVVAAVPADDRQAGAAGNPGCRRRAWSGSTSTWPRSLKSSNCATRSSPRCRTRCSSRSATTTCASR